MTRGGPTSEKDAPERRCIVSGDRGPKEHLIRFVIGPDDTVVPDLAEKLPGRGIWVSADRAAIEKAARKGLFSRAARRPVKVGPDLADLVEQRLAARVVELLSLARKAGVAICGLEKVKAALVSEEATCLLQASDGSERERARLRPPKGAYSHFDQLTAAEMGVAFGRGRVIHAALFSGGLAQSVRYESARLAGLRRQ